MKKQDIQKQIQTKEKEIAKLKQKLVILDDEIEWIKITNTDYEVTNKVIHKGKSYKELLEKFGEEYLNEHLLTLKQIGEICEHPELLKELKMDSSSTEDDFFFKQPFPQNKKNNYVARFFAYSDYSNLNCMNSPVNSDSVLGVRFVRKIKKGERNNGINTD